jgi:chorismate mutase-like protein
LESISAGFLKLSVKMELENLRKQIDEIDQKLLHLINQRADLALVIVEIKKNLSLPIFDSEREKKILDRIKSNNHGPLSEESVEKIFSAIIQEHRLLEQQNAEK